MLPLAASVQEQCMVEEMGHVKKNKEIKLGGSTDTGNNAPLPL
jgi:hypothetical protein